jgi:hypothetical protein
VVLPQLEVRRKDAGFRAQGQWLGLRVEGAQTADRMQGSELKVIV